MKVQRKKILSDVIVALSYICVFCLSVAALYFASSKRKESYFFCNYAHCLVPPPAGCVIVWGVCGWCFCGATHFIGCLEVVSGSLGSGFVGSTHT